jgi:hypothetical protein
LIQTRILTPANVGSSVLSLAQETFWIMAFRVLSTDELDNEPDLSWRVADLIPVGGFTLLYGQTNVGKSFLAIDLALSMATGRPWGGRVVRQARVGYVVGEGFAGHRQRVRAWRLANHGNQRVSGFLTIDRAVRIADSKERNQLADTARKQQLDVIVLDTLVSCAPGLDENSAQDMGLVVAGIHDLREETGADVLLIHHAGLNTKRARGSTVVPGAADCILALRPAKQFLRLVCEKQRDAEKAATMTLQLQPQHGSCVMRVLTRGADLSAFSKQPSLECPGMADNVLSTTPAISAAGPVQLTKRQAQALRALPLDPTNVGFEPGQWIEATGMDERTLRHVRKQLVAKDGPYGFVQRVSGYYQLTERGRAWRRDDTANGENQAA